MAAVRGCTYVRLTNRPLRLVIAISGFLWLLNPCHTHSGASDEQIVVNQGRYGPYYHLSLKLKAEIIDFAQSDRVSRSGGQFELKLRREKFPVPAPNCRGSIILRMPWTSPRARGAKEKIAAKEELLKRIWALETHPNEVLPVVIELNPYVEVVSRTPLKLQLTQCNVFFRDAYGAYVDAIGPVKKPR
jgi:hypothetical protein